MKGMDIFCASQASTAICLSMEQLQASSSSPTSSSLLLGRAIDRYNPIIRDSTRIAKTIPLPPPCNNSQPPISPKPQKNQNKKKNKKNPSKENGDLTKILDSFTANKLNDEKRKNSTEKTTNEGHANRKSWSCTRPGNFISPPGSTRYLLNDKAFFNVLSDVDPALKLFPAETSKSKAFKTEELSDANPPSSSPNQVVVLRVSLHCKGCEKKMRKHISRMEGVTSFNIDFAAKKVTVTGNVTPSGVLSSISKVKNAQLWSPTLSTTYVPPLNSSNSGFKNDYKCSGA